MKKLDWIITVDDIWDGECRASYRLIDKTEEEVKEILLKSAEEWRDGREGMEIEVEELISGAGFKVVVWAGSADYQLEAVPFEKLALFC